MRENRRAFMKTTGLAGAAGLSGLAPAGALAQPTPTARPARLQPLPRGLSVATIATARGMSLGIRTDAGVLDVQLADTRLGLGVPWTMTDLLQGRGDVGALTALVEKAKGRGDLFIAEADAKFGPCVTDPEKIICIGLNYRAHVAEANEKLPPLPILFNKFNSSLNHHGGSIAVSKEKVAKAFDYEAELVIVMGRTARDVSEADALSYVFGYCVGNDFSARDLQFESNQWMAGKAGDGWGPIGPWLVTADQIDPGKLDIECSVNGEKRQSSNTSSMIFDCRKLISFISARVTLQPGDIIFTGTPDGVIIGYPKDKQVWLKKGDVITTRIEKLGSLEFRLT
jgi:2-keto-4-pentenoate hydratase/2-oxohepta-3-ene-1,7-dioic acid hydratase in catechol pathway